MNLDFYKGKKVLVTGHTGFKGTWLCKMLLKQGAEVCGFALEPKAEQVLFELSKIEKDMQSVICDIRDYEALRKIYDSFAPEIVIHLAAQPIVKDSYIYPKLTYETNVLGTLNILECIRKTDCVRSFLNVTTEKVYENNEEENVTIDETFPLNGYDPYSNSKSCSDIITQCYKKCFLNEGRCAVSTARTSNAIGGGDFSQHRIISDCMKAAINGTDILVRNKYSERPYQYVLEPLSVYLKICQMQYDDISYQGSYNVAPDFGIKTEKIVSLFCQKWGNYLKWIDCSVEGPYEASLLKVSNMKLKETFGWKQKYSIEKTIEKIVEWTRCYITSPDMIDWQMNKEIDDFMSFEKE